MKVELERARLFQPLSDVVMSLASLCVPSQASLQKFPSICALGFSCRQRLCVRIRILFLHTVLVTACPTHLEFLHYVDINRTHQVQRNKSSFALSPNIDKYLYSSLSVHKY